MQSQAKLAITFLVEKCKLYREITRIICANKNVHTLYVRKKILFTRSFEFLRFYFIHFFQEGPNFTMALIYISKRFRISLSISTLKLLAKKISCNETDYTRKWIFFPANYFFIWTTGENWFQIVESLVSILIQYNYFPCFFMMWEVWKITNFPEECKKFFPGCFNLMNLSNLMHLN